MSKLQAEYWDAQDKILKEVGISLKKKKKKKVDKNQIVECLVCCDDVSTEIPFCRIIFQHNVFSSSLITAQIKQSKACPLDCGHGPYCANCWREHLSVTVRNSSAEGILNVTCMWPRCPIK